MVYLMSYLKTCSYSNTALVEWPASTSFQPDTIPNSISPNFIPFNQAEVISKLDPEQHKTLLGFDKKYDGLCELICNRILIDGSIGKETHIDSLKNRITVERLNEQKITKSHLLNIYWLFQKLLAFLFGIYPDNIFSCHDQWKLVRNGSVNRTMLEKGLHSIANGETLKLEVFRKACFSFEGHSLLIKKVSNDQYIFFDPNTGEHRDLSLHQISDHIDTQLTMWTGTDIFLTKGRDFLKRLPRTTSKA